MTHKPLSFWKKAGKLAFSACLLLPVLAYAYLGFFNRMMADDYFSRHLAYDQLAED